MKRKDAAFIVFCLTLELCHKENFARKRCLGGSKRLFVLYFFYLYFFLICIYLYLYLFFICICMYFLIKLKGKQVLNQDSLYLVFFGKPQVCLTFKLFTKLQSKLKKRLLMTQTALCKKLPFIVHVLSDVSKQDLGEIHLSVTPGKSRDIN